MSASMRVVAVEACGGPDVLRLATRAVPRAGPNQAVVKVLATGINPVDTYRRAGAQGYAPASFPLVLGSEGAGVVHELGPGTEGSALRVGSRVLCAGSLSGLYAQYALCSLEQLVPVPDGVGLDAVAVSWVAGATAYHAIWQVAQLDEVLARLGRATVLVHGASGGVGLACLQLLRTRENVHILGTAGTPDGLALVRANGAHAAFDHHSEAYMDAVLAETSGEGVDVVLEMLANVNLARDLKVLAYRGRVAVIGSRGCVERSRRSDIMAKRSEVRGVRLYNADAREMAELKDEVVGALASGALRPVISRVYKLDEVAQSHVDIIEGHALGKFVLHPWDEADAQ